MNKYIIKIMSIILTIILFISAIPMSSYAYECFTSGDWTYCILNDGTAEIRDAWGETENGWFSNYAYTGEITDVVIPQEIDGYIVTSIGRSEVGFTSTPITSVVIPDTVLSISSDVFSEIRSLEKVVLSNNLTKINSNTFSSCTSLASISIPDSVIEISNYAFSDCSSLANIYLPQNLTTIGNYAFSNCTALKNIIIPESVTSIGLNAFPTTTTIYGYLDSYAETYAEQYGLNFVPISKYSNDTIYTPITKNKIELTKYLGDERTFEISATLDDYSVVAVADEAFKDNNYITEITAEDSLLYVGVSAFQDCKNLTTVILPDSVENVGTYAFAGCKNLSKVVLSSGLATIEEYTFKNCQSLKSIVIPESVTEIDLYAFYNCLNLDTIYGVTGSYAETFANENGYEFIDASNIIIDVIASNITIIENSDGYESYDNNGNEFFYYYTSFMYNDVEYTVEYGNGKTEKLRYYELEELTGGSFDFENNQYDKPFQLGTNMISFACGDISSCVKLIIVENPVVSISVSDVAIIEGTCGYFTDEYDENGEVTSQYYHYSNYATPFVATLIDGTTVDSNEWGGIELYDMGYSLDVSDNQAEEHWSVGDNIATGSLFGITDDFTVAITETPIESIVCEDVEIIENTNGYYTNGYNPETDSWDLEYYNYNVYCNGKVTMKDGTIIELENDSSIEFNGEWYQIELNDNQSENPWKIYNTYTVNAYVMGVSFSFDVSIIDTKIETMTITPMRDLIEGVDSQNGWYDMSCLDYMLDITYKDGTSEIKTKTFEDACYGEGLELIDNQSEASWEIGTHTVTAKYEGYTATFEVDVVENPYIDFTISSENGLTLCFTKKDGTTISTQPYYLYDGRGGDGCVGGALFTDIGIYNADFFFAIDDYRDYKNKDVRIVIGDMESNTLEENDWLNAMLFSRYFMTVASCIPKLNGFNGTIDNENIDAIVGACFIYCDIETIESVELDEHWYSLLNGDEVRNAISEVFGICDVDLSLSSLYDGETDTILSTQDGYGDAYSSFELSYKNEMWTLVRTTKWIHNDIIEKTSVCEMKMNDAIKVTSINWADYVMDVNNDENVDSIDHNLVIDESILRTNLTRSQELAADVNGDGAVDGFDALHFDLYLNGMLN